jgi:hypothetical protein
MAFVAAHCQVGKTTVCRSFVSRHHYFNWDNDGDRRLLFQVRQLLLKK